MRSAGTINFSGLYRSERCLSNQFEIDLDSRFETGSAVVHQADSHSSQAWASSQNMLHTDHGQSRKKDMSATLGRAWGLARLRPGLAVELQQKQDGDDGHGHTRLILWQAFWCC
ncbi:hypothetical protein HRR83_004301 [Exophiala dermatitidis]|uniref:Uncharacterized protein n=1 Tax=Exophiala dermatitidis TaxID=5970 RepID=A0AAN6ESS8_EXODE|nr:hypothetical protein HRR73_006236 [Exophiala dermatitidis]KAJ4521394.1 hypothetical protein HRR74_003217 [Exophiala dermatitidis]KAJ4542068.1 hypothetical protein HRR77_005953 [Exophiala dermatitidis]KAJ4544833.1 hypothetical protein HRR76_002870 [Exophiala dermatitidis]KAJ4565308.1 hypothetical protein HRR79_005571 [Exophiala dermatitidis]